MNAYHFIEEFKAHLDAVIVDELFGEDQTDRISKVDIDNRGNQQLQITMQSGKIFILAVVQVN